MKKPLTLLVDADILVYQIACALQDNIDWQDGVKTQSADLDKAIAQLDAWDTKIRIETKATEVVYALTDGVNWRKEVLPTYKFNRNPTSRPLIFNELREHLILNYSAYLRPTLEGDDILGILATNDHIYPGDKIIYSIDKDMQTLPVKRLVKGKILSSTTEEAFRYHMLQTLTGDTTDGYKGCPGIGPKKANKILDAAEDGLWTAVVKAYEAKGLTEADALVQARVSRICQSCDFDFENKKVILWNPPAQVAA